MLFVRLEVVAVGDAANLVRAIDQSFSEEEPSGQLEVAARRPHRDGDGHGGLARAFDADLHRLFRREDVGAFGGDTGIHRGRADACDVPAKGYGLGHLGHYGAHWRRHTHVVTPQLPRRSKLLPVLNHGSGGART